MSQLQNAFDFKHMDAEKWLIRRLGEHGASVFTGITDVPTRIERYRAAILDAGLGLTIVGRNAAGKCETYAQLFERLFNEPLQPKRKGKSNAQA